jgi:hypothetical protein
MDSLFYISIFSINSFETSLPTLYQILSEQNPNSIDKIPELESFSFFYFSKNSLKVTNYKDWKLQSSLSSQKEPNYNAHNRFQSLYQQLQRLYERNLDSYVDYFYQSCRHDGFAILSKYLKEDLNLSYAEVGWIMVALVGIHVGFLAGW